MISLVIFDLDGTLLNSISGVNECFNKVLANNNMPTFSEEEFGNFVGGDLEQVVGKLLPKELINDRIIIEKVKKEYRMIYSDYSVKYSVAYDGIKDLLIFLDQNGIKMAISTNKNQKLTDGIINSIFNYVPFISIVGSEGGFAPKPSRESVDYIMAKANVNAESTVYVGDTASDVFTAKNSGIKCLYASWGQGKKEDIYLYDNMVIFQKVEDMQEYFKENICVR